MILNARRNKVNGINFKRHAEDKLGQGHAVDMYRDAGKRLLT